jgi:diazepam-binding inhibitor (GABA receptor modulator, acyl-CoA-binding protein)
MEDLLKQFEQATVNVKSKVSLDNDQLLKLYSLYKQATAGNNDSDPPSNPFDFIGKAKHEAWSSLSGMTKESAMKSYIDFVASI